MSWKELYEEGKIINGIDGFRDKYECLSNFYPMDIDIRLMSKDGKDTKLKTKYIEVIFQALKCKNQEDVVKFNNLTCGQAKRLGRNKRKYYGKMFMA